MKKASVTLLLVLALTTSCTSPSERAEALAKNYNRQYELFMFECREAMNTFASEFEENVSIGRYDSRRSALHCLDSLLHICQHDYTARLNPILDEYRRYDSRRYRLLGEYRQQFEQTFDHLLRHRATDSTAFMDSLMGSPRVWGLLNSIGDPALPGKEEMARQLVGTRVYCAGDPFFGDSCFVLEAGKVTVERVRTDQRVFNSQTGNNNLPVEIAFSHGGMEFKGTVTANYELHDGDLDWQLKSVASRQIAFQPNHAYDRYVQSRVCTDGSWLQRLHLINRSDRPVLVGYWVKYEQVGNLIRHKKEYTLERGIVSIGPAPNHKMVVHKGELRPSAAAGGVAFVIPQ